MANSTTVQVAVKPERREHQTPSSHLLLHPSTQLRGEAHGAQENKILTSSATSIKSSVKTPSNPHRSSSPSSYEWPRRKPQLLPPLHQPYICLLRHNIADGLHQHRNKRAAADSSTYMDISRPLTD